MTDALSISEMSLINDLNQMKTISNNIANSNTAAFKRDVTVADTFRSQLEMIQVGVLDENGLEQHSLVPKLKTIIDQTQGALNRTGNPLDIAIEGDGFFEIDTPGGLRYIRGGSFALDSMGRIVSAQGFPIMGLNGEIRLLGTEPKIDQHGRIYEDEEYLTQLKIVRFDDSASLNALGKGIYDISSQSQPETQEYPDVKQGFLEASNVKAMDEMVKMMMTVRHMESTKQVIQGYDQIMGEAISTIAEF